MDSETWEQVKEAIDEGQELSFDYKGDEWWISRVQADDSFLLTRSSDSDTQYFKTAEDLYQHGVIDDKAFIDRVPEL